MGLFDWFQSKRSEPAAPKADAESALPQLCYDVAYRILPHYAFQDLAMLENLCRNTPTAAGPFFYSMAAAAREVEPVAEDAVRFRWHLGQLKDGREYFALEYPEPPPVDMSDFEQLLARGEMPKVVLAPHFSAIVRGAETVDCFILGQAPLGGGTTLRCILPEGLNCNLGPGPAPTLDAFLAAIERRQTSG